MLSPRLRTPRPSVPIRSRRSRNPQKKNRSQRQNPLPGLNLCRSAVIRAICIPTRGKTTETTACRSTSSRAARKATSRPSPPLRRCCRARIAALPAEFWTFWTDTDSCALQTTSPGRTMYTFRSRRFGGSISGRGIWSKAARVRAGKAINTTRFSISTRSTAMIPKRAFTASLTKSSFRSFRTNGTRWKCRAN